LAELSDQKILDLGQFENLMPDLIGADHDGT
jgi:hypothetical protein